MPEKHTLKLSDREVMDLIRGMDLLIDRENDCYYYTAYKKLKDFGVDK